MQEREREKEEWGRQNTHEQRIDENRETEAREASSSLCAQRDPRKKLESAFGSGVGKEAWACTLRNCCLLFLVPPVQTGLGTFPVNRQGYIKRKLPAPINFYFQQ